MDILKKLWKIKEDNKLTDKDLENELGVDRMTIWHWRKLNTTPSNLAIEKIQEFIKKHE